MTRAAALPAPLAALALAAALSSACARPPAPELPATLAETGLYADASLRELAPGVLPFAPQYPLWSDGAAKRRWVLLPPGESIDASAPDAWVFPAGTRFWKEFSFGRRIETRFMRLGDDGAWRFASYVWSEDGSGAALAPEGGVRAACEASPGVAFDVPSRADCRACHDAGPNAVLGFGALQLSGDRDPLAPHAEPLPEGALDLAQLARLGLVRGLPEELLEVPPRIDAASPRERAALGYLHANCGMCHSGAGELAGLGLDLWTTLADAPDRRALDTTLARASRFRFHADEDAARIEPGEPDASVLLRRMASRQPLSRMPPLGTRVPDERALDLVAEWIRADLAPERAVAARSTTD